MLAFVTCVARNANHYFYYPFAYLVLEQQFLCDAKGTGIYTSCTKEQICSSGDRAIPFKVDESYEYFIQNWYTEMDLLCTTTPTIGLMLTTYFIGFALGGFAYTLPDRYGRKNCMLFGLGLSCFAQTIMLSSDSFGVRTLMFFLMGLA